MTEKELLAKFKKAKAERDDAKNALDKAQHQYDMLEQDLIEHLESIDATATAKYDDLGYAMMPKPRLYASCRAENQDILFAYLKKEGREDLIKTSVNTQSLSQFVKESIENGTHVPPFINYYLKSSIRIY